MFSPELAEKPFIVAFNKMDLPEASENWPSFREELQARGIEPFCMSAVTRNGTQEITNSAYELVKKNAANKEEGKQPFRICIEGLLFALHGFTVYAQNLIFISFDDCLIYWYLSYSRWAIFIELELCGRYDEAAACSSYK